MKNEIKQINELYKRITFFVLKKNIKTFSELKVHPSWHFIFEIIRDNPGIKSSSIAIKSNREKATITKTLQRLEKRDFIYKKLDVADNRSYKVYLTNKGKKAVKTIEKFEKEQEKILSDALSKEEIKNYLNILKKLEKKLEEELTYEDIKDSI